jgi:hypothetical protein
VSDNEHLPAPSVWPFVVGAAVTLMAFGVTTSLAFSMVGAILLAWGVVNWVRELRHG